MSRLSVKIGLLFLVFMVMIQSVLFFALYWTLAEDRVDEVFSRLVLQGDSHAEALVSDFDEMTLSHIVLMEENTERNVIITDDDLDVLATNLTGGVNTAWMDEVALPADNGVMVMDNWQGADTIASVSPVVIGGSVVGYVWLEAPSEQIGGMITQLTIQFAIGGLFSLVMTVVTVLLLTRVIAVPLRKMKDATDKLAKGDMHVTLGYDREDELGELELSIRRLAQDLEKLKKERNEFLAGIAHELKTPLTYMKGYADIAGRESTGEEDRRKYLGILQEESENLSRLVADLFDLAKLDSNAFEIEKEPLDMSEFMQAFSDELEPVLKDNGMTLKREIDKGLVCEADRDRFRQVLRNLTDNAIRHSETGSMLTLRAKRQDDGSLQIAVADQGEGIAKHHLSYLFERMYRAERSRSRATGGSGIGLSIVKSITDRHGWTISVDSEPDKGTTMVIKIPKEDMLDG